MTDVGVLNSGLTCCATRLAQRPKQSSDFGVRELPWTQTLPSFEMLDEGLSVAFVFLGPGPAAKESFSGHQQAS